MKTGTRIKTLIVIHLVHIECCTSYSICNGKRTREREENLTRKIYITKYCCAITIRYISQSNWNKKFYEKIYWTSAYSIVEIKCSLIIENLYFRCRLHILRVLMENEFLNCLPGGNRENKSFWQVYRLDKPKTNPQQHTTHEQHQQIK